MTEFLSPSELTQKAQNLLKKKPRNNDELISILSELVKHEPKNWLGNIELAESYTYKEEWNQALIYAHKAHDIHQNNPRANVLLATAYKGGGQAERALEVLASGVFCTKSNVEEAQNRELAISENSHLLQRLFLVISASKTAWKIPIDIFSLLRDVLILLADPNVLGLDEKIVEELALIEPDSALDIIESIRFLQLKSIITRENSGLESWLEAKKMFLSSEELFIAYLLIARIGLFPERFKAFVGGQEVISDELLELTIHKIKSNLQLPCRLRDHNAGNQRYLFMLSAMPFEEWFLRTGPHFKVIVDYVRYLTEIDTTAEVIVLLTNELSEKAGASHFGRWPYSSDADLYAKGFDLHYPGYDRSRIRFQCVQSSLTDDNHRYFSDAIDIIGNIDPDVIVWFGGVLESVIFPRILADRYPSVFRQFNVNNRPRGHFDIGLTYSTDVSARIPGQWVKFEAVYSDLPTEGKIPPETSAFLATGTIILTAGNDLIRRVDGHFIGCAVTTLKKYSHVKWVFVGIKDTEAFLKRFTELEYYNQQDRVVFCSFVDYLGKLLDHTNIFAHPNHKGGGGGIAYAAMKGIPVVCFRGGDSDALFQQDDMVSTYTEFEEKLDRLICDISFRQSQSNRYKHMFGRAKYLTETKRFIDVCETALSIFSQRNL